MFLIALILWPSLNILKVDVCIEELKRPGDMHFFFSLRDIEFTSTHPRNNQFLRQWSTCWQGSETHDPCSLIRHGQCRWNGKWDHIWGCSPSFSAPWGYKQPQQKPVLPQRSNLLHNSYIVPPGEIRPDRYLQSNKTKFDIPRHEVWFNEIVVAHAVVHLAFVTLEGN